jgi:signal transduction histidine kinase
LPRNGLPRLTRYFALNFLLLDLLIVGAGGVVAYQLGRANLLSVAEQYGTAAVNHLARSIDKFYLEPWQMTFDTFPFDHPLAHRELTGIVQTFVSGFQVERISIYDKNYTIVFSTDSVREGSKFPTNSHLLSALSGQTSSYLSEEQTPEHMSTATDDPDHMVAFIPIDFRTEGDGKERFVFEILMNVAETYKKVEQLRLVIIISTLLTGLALFLVVWVIAVRADKSILAESRARAVLAEQIQRQNENLELTVEQRTQELRDAQAGLVQMEKMSATGQLAAGVAHEINNPVGIIKNRLEILIDDLKDGKQIDDLADHLGVMHRQTDRITKIVSKLLSFARKSSETKTQINVESLIRGVELLVGKEAEKRGLVLSSDIEHGLPMIKGENTELEQVLLNLILNAMDATAKGGTIRIFAGQVNDRVQIRVEDTGEGIDTTHIHKIYDPFFTTKDVGVGTGLGLSISYRIVEDHGGTIVVASEQGTGTTFTLTFPAEGAQRTV